MLCLPCLASAGLAKADSSSDADEEYLDPDMQGATNAARITQVGFTLIEDRLEAATLVMDVSLDNADAIAKLLTEQSFTERSSPQKLKSEWVLAF